MGWGVSIQSTLEKYVHYSIIMQQSLFLPRPSCQQVVGYAQEAKAMLLHDTTEGLFLHYIP